MPHGKPHVAICIIAFIVAVTSSPAFAGDPQFFRYRFATGDTFIAEVDLERSYTLTESAVFGVGAGVGWALAIVALAAIRERLRYSNVPRPLRGLGITFLIVGLMAFGFMSFSGIRL